MITCEDCGCTGTPEIHKNVTFTFEHCQAVGAKYTFSMKLQAKMEKQRFTKEKFAKRIDGQSIS